MAKKFNADSIGSLNDKSKKKINKAFSDNGINSIDDLIDAITSSGGGDGGFGGGGRPETFSDIRSMKDTNKEATRLLKVLKDIKENGIRVASPEDQKTLKEMGLNLKDMEGSSKKVEQNLKNAKFDNNFANRLTAINGLVKGIGNSLSNMYGTMQNIVEPWAKANDAASKYAKTVAMSAAGMKAMTDRTIRNVVHSHIGIEYNMSTDELIKAQQSYVQGIGRSLSIDNAQQESLAAMTAVMGDKSTELAAAFENFGVNLNTTAERSGKMFDKASKTGISFEKLTDNVAKNIKIAQNYTFKNGLKGLESMAAKAVALKMDMAQVAALADKVGSVEGSIDVASKLQVLGGPFASMADPLGMLNEGLNDMEGLMDRVTKMVGGMGSFNRQTGQVEVSAFNKKRVQAAAQAMGISYDSLMESVNAQAKRNEVAKQIGTSSNAKNLSDDMKELIKNSATFDKNGKAGVSINGQFKSIDELTNADYDTLIKETQSESDDIKDIAKMLRSHFDVVSGAEKQKDANQAQMVGSVGEGFTKVIDLFGHSNFLLKIIAGAQIAGQAIGMVSDVLDIVRTFRGGRGGGFRNVIRRKAPKVSSKIARAERFVGKTKPGRAFRKARVARYKGVRKLEGRAFKASSKITSKLGGNTGKLFRGGAGRGVSRLPGINAAMEAGYTKLGNAAMTATQKIGGLGASLAGKGGLAGKVGSTMFNAAAKTEGKMIAKAGLTTVKWVAAAETGKAVGKGLVAGAMKGAGVGMAFGIAGAGVEMGRDALERKGKIKKGGAASTLMTITAEQAKWAGIGMMGGWWGAAAGAVVGTITGAVKAVKRKREAKVDDKLSQYGIQRKGDYGARSYKLINKALETGNISDRMRRKLEKKGDYALLNKIDEIKKQKEEDEEAKKDREAQRQALINGGGEGVKKNIRNARFTVSRAYFGGKAFGPLGGGFGDSFGAKLPTLGMLPGLPPFMPFGRFGEREEGGDEKNERLLRIFSRFAIPGSGLFSRLFRRNEENEGVNIENQENGGRSLLFRRLFPFLDYKSPLGNLYNQVSGVGVNAENKDGERRKSFWERLFPNIRGEKKLSDKKEEEKGVNPEDKEKENKEGELSKKLSEYLFVKNAKVESIQILGKGENAEKGENIAKNNNEYSEESIKEGKPVETTAVAKGEEQGITVKQYNSLMESVNAQAKINEAEKQKGKQSKRREVAKGTLKGVAIGAAVGNILPGVGPILGAAIGGLVGGISGRRKNRKETDEEIVKPESHLVAKNKKEYTEEDIKDGTQKRKSRAKSTLSGVAIGAAVGNVIPGIGPILGAAIGGLVGGIRARRKEKEEEKTVEIKGKPEKGESVEAKEMQHKAETKASEEKKKEDEKRKADEEQRKSSFNGGKIDVNITGTIKLEANGKNFNMDELMKDSAFKQELAKLISEQIERNRTQTNVVERK